MCVYIYDQVIHVECTFSTKLRNVKGFEKRFAHLANECIVPESRARAWRDATFYNRSNKTRIGTRVIGLLFLSRLAFARIPISPRVRSGTDVPALVFARSLARSLAAGVLLTRRRMAINHGNWSVYGGWRRRDGAQDLREIVLPGGVQPAARCRVL